MNKEQKTALTFILCIFLFGAAFGYIAGLWQQIAAQETRIQKQMEEQNEP